MFTQLNSQMLAFGKHLTDTAFKAHSLTVEGMERIVEMNLKALEAQTNATLSFWTQAAEARDLDSLKSMWPKSVNLVKQSTENMYHNGQEVLGVSLKTSEALGELAKGTIEAANETFGKNVHVANETFSKNANTAQKAAAK